jgi:hypothetical protein
MKSLTFYKAMEVEVPVWNGDERTGETETRVTVIFKESVAGRGGFQQNRYGSFMALRGYTVEQVNADFSEDEDLSEEFALVEREGTNFCKVVAL